MGSFTLHADFNALDGGSSRTETVNISSNVQVIADGGIIYDSASVTLEDGILQVQLPADDNDPGDFGYTIRRATGLTKTWRVPAQAPGATVELTDFTATTPLPLPASGNAVSQTAFEAYQTSNDEAMTTEEGARAAADTALTSGLAAEVSRATTAEGLKAPIASPTFTGTVAGVTKSMVGLGSVDNTADTAKPVSTAQATADTAIGTAAATDATTKANAAAAASTPVAHGTSTANPHAVTKAQVGLGSVDNTADTAKPVSTAQTAAFLPKLNPQVAVTGNNTSLDITATADKATFKVLRYNNVSGPSWATGAIINSQGAFHSNAWMVLSGHMPGSPNTEGLYYPLLASLSQATASMLSIWSDVDSCAMEVRTNSTTAGNRIFDGLDFNGINRFSIGPFGELQWGSGTYAQQDAMLVRTNPGTITISRPDAAGDVSLKVNAGTGSFAAKVITQVNSVEAFSINAVVTSAYFLQGGACVFRTNKINAGASMAVGGTDDVSAILGSYNVAHVAKHVLLGRGMAGQTGALLRLEDSASAVMFSVNAAGGPGAYGTTPPAAKRTTTADATDLATVITLANALKADLQAYGLKA